MVHNPGGDWNPGRGDNPIYTLSDVYILSETFNGFGRHINLFPLWLLESSYVRLL